MKKKYSRILGVALALVLLASLFGFAAPVSAANVAWSGIANPSTVRLNLADCDVGPIAVTPDGNTLFAAVETEAPIPGISTAAGQWALLQSTDGGHNWTATGLIMNPGPITGIAISPNFATDGTMYVAAQSGTLGTPAVFRTQNSGTTFTEIKAVTAEAVSGDPTTVINSIDMWPASPYPYVMVGTDTDVWVLQDAPFGIWRDQEIDATAPVDIAAVAFAPDFATTNYIWAVTVAGEVTTTNSPGAWGTILGDAPLSVTAVSADIGFPDGYSSMTAPYLWVALNGGSNSGGVWRIRGLPGESQAIPQLTNVDIRSIAVSGDMATATILAGRETPAAVTGALIVGSNNGGVMWMVPVMKQPTGDGVTYVVMAPDFATSNVAYVATSDLVEDRFTFQTGPTGVGVAEWSTAEQNTGNYSAFLSDDGVGYDTAPTAFGAGRVVISGVNILLDDITALSYWFNYNNEPSSYPWAFPYMILELDTTVSAVLDGVADGWIVLFTSESGYWQPAADTWLQWDLATYDYWIGFGDADCGVAEDSPLSDFQADTDLDDAVVLAVKVAVGEWHTGSYTASEAYVDDIIITTTTTTTTYDLERDSSAFQVSGNGGMSWNQTGLIDTSIGSIDDLAVVSLDTIFMVSDNDSLWKTEDATATAPVWERILSLGTATFPMHTLANITSVETSPEFATDGVVYAADSVRGIVKAIDGGSIFAPLPQVTANITTLHVVDATFAFLGAASQVYRTDDGGYSWLPATTAPAVGPPASIISIATSPAGAMPPGQLMVGDAAGNIFMSMNRGVTFFPLGVGETLGNAYVAFDPGYATNSTVYAGGGDVIKRFNVAVPTAPWTLIDTLATTSVINGLVTSPDGTLYGSNGLANQGMERSLNPTASATGPAEGAITSVFETVTRYLLPSATLNGLWLRVDETLDVTGSKNVLFSINTAANQIMTYTDTLATPVVLTAPEADAIFPRAGEVTLQWETLTGAQMYYWEIARDAMFVLDVDSGFSIYPTDMSIKVTAGRTYYWRVRVDGPDVEGDPGAPGLPVLSRWSETRTFSTYLGDRPWSPDLTNVQGVYANQVPLKPSFQWEGADWATGYEFVLADNAELTSPLVSTTVSTTAYACTVELSYSSTYFWQVRAVSATSESEWSDVSTFTTMAEPVEAAPPVVIQDVPDIIVEQPDIIVQEVTPVSPGYLLAIIIIGAVLVIFVIALIVRTRRPV